MATTPSEKAAILREAAEMVDSSAWAEQQLMYEAAKLGDEKALAWVVEQGWYGPVVLTGQVPVD